jgi:hypothetical protein
MVVRATALAVCLLAATVNAQHAPPNREKPHMNEWFEFEALKALTGAPYEAARRKWQTALVPERARLAALAADHDWRTATQARILIGWIDHGAEYDTLLQRLDAEDVQRAGRTAAGLSSIWDRYQREAATRLRETVLPLCWESLLKHADDWPSWKLIAFVRMLVGVPHVASAEPLIWFLEHADDEPVARTATQALARLPRDAALAALARAAADGDRVRSRVHDAVEDVKRAP